MKPSGAFTTEKIIQVCGHWAWLISVSGVFYFQGCCFIFVFYNKVRFGFFVLFLRIIEASLSFGQCWNWNIVSTYFCSDEFVVFQISDICFRWFLSTDKLEAVQLLYFWNLITSM